MTIRMSLMLLAAAGATQAAVASDIHVCPTCAHTTIQSAVNDAASNDTIIIAAGRYTENITIEGKSLTLEGADFLGGVTDVAAAGRGPVFTLGTGVAGATPQLIALINLTISGGNHTGGTGAGGGVQVRAGAYLQLSESIVARNLATKGAGVAIDSPGSPVSVITNCQIINNWANGNQGTVSGPGGGVMVGAGSAAAIHSSNITGNISTDGGGVFADVNTQLTVTDSNISNNISQPFDTPQKTFARGGGGGLESSGSFDISGTTLNNNLALGPTGGGGMYLTLHSGGDHTISTSMIALNNTMTANNPALGIGAGVVATGVSGEPQQTLTLDSVYIVENLQFGGLWIEGVALSSTDTTVKDNVGGQICSSAEGTCTN